MATPEPIRDPILDRPLPSSPDTERAILGAIILDNSLIAQAVELLKASDFYVPSHRRIFIAMIRLFERGSEINPILIAEELRRDNSLDQSGGILFLTNLTNGLPHVTSIVQFAKVVRGKSLLRQLVKTAEKITARNGVVSATATGLQCDSAKDKKGNLPAWRATLKVVPVYHLVSAKNGNR